MIWFDEQATGFFPILSIPKSPNSWAPRSARRWNPRAAGFVHGGWLCLGLLLLLPGILGASIPEAESELDSVSIQPASSDPSWLDPETFPVPPELEPNVAFWTKVYSEHGSNHVLLHDDRYLQVIYTILDFSKLEEANLSDHRRRLLKRKAIEQARAKYRGILDDLAAGRDSSEYRSEQARVAVLFADVPGGRDKFSAATRRLRTQTCLKDRFAEGIERSGLYLPMIERVFEERGLPRALTRLPFVESLFQTNARSVVAAGGIWQFMPSTARLFMKMELEYDQRYDPHTATQAAASLLGKNYEALQSWPLAITAYNHGANGMRRAVRTLGTRDIGKISAKYRSRTFGFASRNFYSEFIAAAQVYADRAVHFPETAPRPELRSDIFVPDQYVSIRSLASASSIDLDTLKLHNPSLSSQVWAGHLFLPKGYGLRVPEGLHGEIKTAYAGLPAGRKSAHQVGFRYRVRSGDTLASIAGKFGSSVRALQNANKISNPNRIRIGQSLLIPPGQGRPGPVTRTADVQVVPQPDHHVVRSGETLSSIAQRYGTSAQALQAVNGLASAHQIRIGQRLKLPGGGQGEATTHVVRQGETLAQIARRYGISVRTLQLANSIRGHLIRPAQVLTIPCSVC